MPYYAFGPTLDAMWGNAILSRYPIVESRVYELPKAHVTPYDRGYLAVTIDVGGGQTLGVIATHLTHVDGEGSAAARAAQAAALAAAWDGRPATVVLGDFNAEPGGPDLASLREAGLLDAYVPADAGAPGFTSPARDPQRRIDLIWLSPDLVASGFATGVSRASDHLPVSVTVAVR
jgi:endonuclease/exonuclease/phosphatase family metal-dependent hydrolase